MAKKDLKEVAVKPEEKAPEVPVMSFEDFRKDCTFHPGIVASFKYEATYGKLEGGLEARTSEAWIKALEEHSNRPYSN